MLSDVYILMVFALGDLIYETLVTLVISSGFPNIVIASPFLMFMTLLDRRSQAGIWDVTTAYSQAKSMTFFTQIIAFVCETPDLTICP